MCCAVPASEPAQAGPCPAALQHCSELPLTPRPHLPPVQDGWRLQRQQVVAFLQALERHYRPNPYHNSTHAADVTQAAAIILRSLRTGVTGITQLEVCACILGAAVHDLAHPGVNNDFLINSRDSNALVYNDRSVNENFHVSTAFTLAYSSPELNVFSGFSREEEKQVGGGHSGLAGWCAGAD